MEHRVRVQSEPSEVAVKGSTTARGYGAPHQRTRASWKPLVDAGEVACWRCGRLIVPGSPWDLGHDDGDRSVYRGPEHMKCNRGSAARRGAAVRHARRRRTTSLEW